MTDTANTGGPAFPTTPVSHGYGPDTHGSGTGSGPGMTLLDWFAPKAPEWWLLERVKMLRQIDHHKMLNDKSCTYQERSEVQLIAAAQYEYADAMIKARSA